MDRQDPLSVALGKEIRRQLRRARRRARWVRCVTWVRAVAAHLKLAAQIIASATAIATSAAAAWRFVGMYRARWAPPVLPAPTGVPTTADGFTKTGEERKGVRGSAGQASTTTHEDPRR